MALRCRLLVIHFFPAGTDSSMAGSAPKRLFTLERQQKSGKAPLQVGRMAPQQNEAGTRVTADNSEVLEALAELRQEMLDAGVIGEVHDEIAKHQDASDQMADETEEARNTVHLLRAEISALAHLIQQTKMEISAVRSSDPDQDKILAMTNELDAVVMATEGATNNILEVAEAVDDLADKIRTESTDDDSRHQAEGISEQMMKVYEACNFQDLTGQRITKVVNTLMYVEERLNKMIEIWGEDDTLHADADHVEPNPEEAHEEAHLLNGPALENQGISQADIDALFD